MPLAIPGPAENGLGKMSLSFFASLVLRPICGREEQWSTEWGSTLKNEAAMGFVQRSSWGPSWRPSRVCCVIDLFDCAPSEYHTATMNRIDVLHRFIDLLFK